jgi:hypothetical protein
MVWSSVQPHTVLNMGDSCFGAEKALGRVTGEGYAGAQATRTTARFSLSSFSLPTKTPHTRLFNRFSLPLSLAGAGTHSARSILLHDDSPAKAALRLLNHVCPREYDASFRAADIRRLEWRGRTAQQTR